MSKAAPIEAIPFTNDLDQVINPGDKVIVVTKSTGHVAVRRGVYIGSRLVHPATEQYEEYRTVQVEMQQPVTEMRHKVTNEKMHWEVPGTNGRPRMPYQWDTKYGILSMVKIKYGSNYGWKRTQTSDQKALYEADLAQYNLDLVEYNKKWEAYRAEHHQVSYILTYKQSLQCNRIYLDK